MFYRFAFMQINWHSLYLKNAKNFSTFANAERTVEFELHLYHAKNDTDGTVAYLSILFSLFWCYIQSYKGMYVFHLHDCYGQWVKITTKTEIRFFTIALKTFILFECWHRPENSLNFFPNKFTVQILAQLVTQGILSVGFYCHTVWIISDICL